MPVVPEGERMDGLRRLGLSEALVRQSAGESLDPLFSFRCQGPPHFSYHGAGCPDGPPLLPLWDCCDSVTGVRASDRRLEFIEFSIESSEEYTVLAHTEQGLWATVFVNLFEDKDYLAPDAFREAASTVGFRFLDLLAASYYSADTSTFAAYGRFRANLIGTIDAMSAAT